MPETQHRVDELDAEHFQAAAEVVANELAESGAGYYELEPGDATSYRIVVVAHADRTPVRYQVASNFGKLYPWSGSRVHWDYVASHYVDDGHEHTARVLARFLNALHDAIESDGRS